MDAARRWQLASIAGAVTSVAMGGMLLARPSDVPAAPIQLTVVSPGEPGAPEVAVDPPGDDPDGPVIVSPEIVEVIPDGQTPSSPASPDEPSGGSSSASTGTSSSTPGPSSSSSTSGSAPATSSTTRPADPDSIDSVSSVSSDD